MCADQRPLPLYQRQLDFVRAEALFQQPGPTADHAATVARYLRAGLALADQVGRRDRERLLLRLLQNLIERAIDPLQATALRQQCLDNLNRPLLRLHRLYRDDPAGLRRLNALKYELNLMYHDGSGSC